MSRPSAEMRRQVARRAKWRCEYCRAAESQTGQDCVVDYVIPTSRGGANEIDITCVCRARGVIRSNKLRPMVGTTSPAAESDCFIRAAIFGPSISAGIAAVLASCRSRPSGESPRSCCNSTGLGWLKPANFGTPNFADDGCDTTQEQNAVGQECPTSATEARRLAVLSLPRVSDPPDSKAHSEYEYNEQSGCLDRQIEVGQKSRMRDRHDNNRQCASDRKESKDHAISDVSDDAFHGHVSRAFGDLSAA